MDLTTYTGLLAAIPTFAMRTGDVEFTASAATFVLGCEQMLNYGTESLLPLRVSDMEASEDLTSTDGEADLPDDYLEWRGVTVGTLPYEVLDLGTPSDNQRRYGSASSGTSALFQVVGTTLKTFPPSSGDVTLSYYAKIPALSTNRSTNWLLRKAPMVYLYGSLMHSAPFMQDDDRIAMWGKLYGEFLGGLINSDKRARFSRMVCRVAGPTP